jgi:hypothetical protein
VSHKWTCCAVKKATGMSERDWEITEIPVNEAMRKDARARMAVLEVCLMCFTE